MAAIDIWLKNNFSNALVSFKITILSCTIL